MGSLQTKEVYLKNVADTGSSVKKVEKDVIDKGSHVKEVM